MGGTAEELTNEGNLLSKNHRNFQVLSPDPEADGRILDTSASQLPGYVQKQGLDRETVHIKFCLQRLTKWVWRKRAYCPDMDLADLDKLEKNSTLNKLKGSSAVFADVSEMSSTKSPIEAEKSTSCPQGEYADLQLSKKTTSGYMSTGFSATRRPTVTDYQSLDVDNRAEGHVYLSPGEKTAKSSRSMDGHNRVAPGTGERGPELDLDNGEEKPPFCRNRPVCVVATERISVKSILFCSSLRLFLDDSFVFSLLPSSSKNVLLALLTCVECGGL